MATVTVLNQLTDTTVSVTTKTYTETNGVSVLTGTTRKAYANSPIGRQMIEDELSSADSAAIFAKWGNTATIADPEVPEQAEGEGE